MLKAILFSEMADIIRRISLFGCDAVVLTISFSHPLPTYILFSLPQDRDDNSDKSWNKAE